MWCFTRPMGRGTGQSGKPEGDIADWQYPPPNSVAEMILNKVCSQ